MTFAVWRMQRTKQDIDACLNRLTDAQIAHRGAAHENSIANLLLHLEGNMRQWFLHGIGGQPDVRERDEEFAEITEAQVTETRERFAATLGECCVVVGSVPAERMLEKINPQPTGIHGAMTILEAVFQIVAHLQMHAGQIIVLTKQLTGGDLDLSLPRKR
ncbi:DUF1572 domain-containing protein [Granulicella sp. WH15]|nr:DUF1572 domain-containing protein [Granulicella sp. WH15]